jgi:putative transposase
MRGDARTTGAPKTGAIVSRHGRWYASIVLACQPDRSRGVDPIALDWGVETLATIARTKSEPVPIAHPRFLGQSEPKLQAASQARETQKQCSRGWRLANKRVAPLPSTMARQRLDFHHKPAAAMVGGSAAICTEPLQPATMGRRPTPKHDETTGQYVPNGAAATAGLHKAMLDSAPAPCLGILRYQAAEAGVVYAEAPTRSLQPSQRWHACGAVVNKPLRERWHVCPCGASCGRDTNSALVLLAWGLEHVLSIFFAALWLHNGSQELTAGLGTQNRSREP